LAGFEVTLYGRFWVTPEVGSGSLPPLLLLREHGKTSTSGSAHRLGHFPGAVDDLNPADLTALQSHFDPARVKRGPREKVLDDASGLFPGGLVLFEDN